MTRIETERVYALLQTITIRDDAEAIDERVEAVSGRDGATQLDIAQASPFDGKVRRVESQLAHARLDVRVISASAAEAEPS